MLDSIQGILITNDTAIDIRDINKVHIEHGYSFKRIRLYNSNDDDSTVIEYKDNPSCVKDDFMYIVELMAKYHHTK
jgi:hypothetical protein